MSRKVSHGTLESVRHIGQSEGTAVGLDRAGWNLKISAIFEIALLDVSH